MDKLDLKDGIFKCRIQIKNNVLGIQEVHLVISEI